jgi:two-component system nitrate/nitrite response regulator NarL
MPSASRASHPRTSTTVAIADAHPLFRDALSRTVAAHLQLELVASADSLQALRGSGADGPPAPDVLVLDSDLLPRDGDRDRGHGAGWTGWTPPPTLLLVAERLDPAELYAALEAGVAGYVSKEATGEVLCRAIVDVARGITVLDPDAQAALAGEVRLRTRDDRPQLTRREHEVLALIAQGRTAPQIAGHLHLSTATIKTHQLHLYGKLGVTERAAAVAVAMRLGLLE